MNVSTYVSDVTSQVAQVPLSSLPSIFWRYYIQYLWDYQPNSWVARIASMSRVLAILISLPIIVLALLDISSYVIARTLGVIDDVKASTSDLSTLHQEKNVPSAFIHKSVAPLSDCTNTDSDRELKHPANPSIHDKTRNPISSSISDCPDSVHYLDVTHPHLFYASEENNLKLSGVGVFSPATSRPPSPAAGRGSLYPEGKGLGQELDDSLHFRRQASVKASSD